MFSPGPHLRGTGFLLTALVQAVRFLSKIGANFHFKYISRKTGAYRFVARSTYDIIGAYDFMRHRKWLSKKTSRAKVFYCINGDVITQILNLENGLDKRFSRFFCSKMPVLKICHYFCHYRFTAFTLFIKSATTFIAFKLLSCTA